MGLLGELVVLALRAGKAKKGYEDGKNGNGPDTLEVIHPLDVLRDDYIDGYRLGQIDKTNKLLEKK